MRYLLAENTYAMGRFDTGLGAGVTLTLYDVSTGNSVPLDSNVCTELGVTGYYQWNTSNITTPPVTKIEYLWVMTDGATETAGKFVLGGFPDGIKDQTDQMNFNGTEIQARVADKGVLNNPPSESINDYKATGFSVPNEYDGVLTAIQADLDNPDQYKADVSSVALEATSQDIKDKTDNLPTDPADQSQVEVAISSSESNVRGGSDTLNTLSSQVDSVQSDLNNPDQYKADVSGIADDVWVNAIAVQLATDMTFVKNIEGGRWRIVDSEMIFYDSSGEVEIARFALFEVDGTTPATRPEDMYERRRVL
jgi:hypothetical protein